MQLSLDLSTAGPRELKALSALIDSLLGRSTAPVTATPTVTVDVLASEKQARQAAIIEEVEARVAASPPPANPAEALLQAHAATVAAAATGPSGAELDADGVPWDARIHAKPPSQIADKTWRKKRGVDADYHASVTAQLKQAQAAPAAPFAPVETPNIPAAPAAPPSNTPVAPSDPVTAFAPPPPAQAAPPAPVVEAPQPPVAAPAPEATGGYTADMAGFAKLMTRITTLEAAGTPPTRKNEVAQQLGLTAARDLVQRTDLIPAFAEMMG